MSTLALCFFAAAVVGVVLTAVQSLSLRRHLSEVPPVPRRLPGLSILKPLCGADDELAENLSCFAALDYPCYELLLGVASPQDAAYPLACEAQRRWPGRVRVVLQRGEPGLNPKINQLIGLAAAARHAIVVVSDSNVRVEPGYLHEIAALLEDPEVGLVTHAVAGQGASSLGSRLEALHLDSGVSGGLISAQRVAGKSYVVGKSMALRQADLRALGGFAAFKDVLAEDFAMGRAVSGQLGRRVAHGKRPVHNVTARRTVEQTFRRFERWAVLQRQTADAWLYASQLLLHPALLAWAAFAARPTRWTAAAAGMLVLEKTLLDGRSAEALTGEDLGWRDWLALPLKDLLVGATWVMGFFEDTVDWRGHPLRVLPGTIIERPEGEAEPTPA
ncbi:MAG: glycosyltransferase [Myxococcales bacterium]